MKHGQKMIAPIVVTLIFVAWFLGVIATCCASEELTFPDMLTLSIIPFGLSCVMIHVCMQRIREIKGGEEDDLSKY